MSNQPLRDAFDDTLKDCSKETQIAVKALLDAMLAEFKTRYPHAKGMSDKGMAEVLMALILKGYRPVWNPPLCTDTKICEQATIRLRRNKAKWLQSNRLTLIYRMRQQNTSMVIRGKIPVGQNPSPTSSENS